MSSDKRSKRSEREVTLSLWAADEPGIHIFYNPFYKTASVEDNDTYWGHLGVNRHYEYLRTKGDMVQFKGFPEAIPKKNIHFPYKVIKNPEKYMRSFDRDTRGALEPIDHTGFGAPVEYKHWNAIVNLLQYDENESDIWGQRRYPCGANLPGSYFDREDMYKEVTFIALAVAEPKKTGDTNEPKLEQLEDYIKTRAAIHTHNQNRYEVLMNKYKDYMDGKPSMKKKFLEKIKKIRKEKALGKIAKKDKHDLTGFLVVKDISYKPLKEWIENFGYRHTPMASAEPFLYVEGLCSNVRGGGALLLDLANIMGHEMGYMGTKLSALTMVISYYFAKFNFRHYTGTFTASRGSRDYMPIPIAMDSDSELGVAWEKYLIDFMRRGSVVQKKWKRLSKQDVDIEHFHRDNSNGVWRDIIGQIGYPGKYPHINAGSEWVRISPRTQSVDINMGDMGYYMYFVYGSEYPPLTDARRFTPTTQFIMGVGSPHSITLEDPLTCYERCTKKGNGFCKKICGFLGVEKYKKQGGRTRRKKRRRRKTKKRRKYKNKKTRRRKSTRKKN